MLGPSVRWLTLVDAIMAIARALLPEPYKRYRTIARALTGNADPEEGVREWLKTPRNVKYAEAADYMSFTGQLAQRPAFQPGFITHALEEERRRRPRTPPPKANERRRKLAAESLTLEDLFADNVLGELRAERWEGRATSIQEGLHGARVPSTTWHQDLEFDPAQGTVNRDGSAYLLGVMLRPAQTESQQQPATSSAEPDPTVTTPTAGAAPRKNKRGPVPGQTDAITKAYLALVPTLQAKRLPGEAYRKTVDRLEESGVIKLPRRGSRDYRIDRLARIWGQVESGKRSLPNLTQTPAKQ